jgi:hypothetical protein
MAGGKGKINEYNKSLTAEQRKASAIKAAKAPRKNQKAIKEIAKIICNAPAPAAAKKSLKEFGVEDEDMTTAALVALAVIRAAIEGDLKAVEKVEKYIGQSDNKREELENKLLEERIKAVQNGTAEIEPVKIVIEPREKQ